MILSMNVASSQRAGTSPPGTAPHGSTAPTRPLPARIAPVAITASGCTTAAGSGLAALATLLRTGGSGLQPNRAPLDFDATGALLPTWIGRVEGLEDMPWPAAWAAWDSRATRLAWAGLQADGFAAAAERAVERHGATRVGLVLGTSASTIGASEQAYRQPAADGGFPPALRHPTLNTPHALAMFVQQALGLEGPAVTVSTACSSSAKAFALGERWLRLGWVDAVVVGGVDALCRSVLFGFNALQLVGAEPCRPFDAARAGISIGEAAGFALLERGAGRWQLIGHGEASDAHHMSSPHPQGLGAEAALDDALARAGIAAEAVDYLNLHGTATALNDAVEAALVARRYGAAVHASATKGATGHLMGAAGLVEALVCGLALEQGLLSGSGPTTAPDEALGGRFAAQWRAAPQQREPGAVRIAASHSFGFGGSNAVLLFARGKDPQVVDPASSVAGSAA
jgi:3-oxoacyl-[acyl-carrier-protein] synthase I